MKVKEFINQVTIAFRLCFGFWLGAQGIWYNNKETMSQSPFGFALVSDKKNL